MRLTRPLVLMSASTVALGLVLALPSQAAPAKQLRQDLTGTIVQDDLFGMHVFNVQDGVWPTVPIGSLRLWDTGTKWAEVEKSQNVFDWSKLDAAVANAQSHGVTDILMVLAGTPQWASSDPSVNSGGGMPLGAAAPPVNFADWDDWVTQLVTRYKGRITSYQPWNEANLLTFFTGTPAQMADLTKRTYDIVQRIDPAATVVAPSVGLRLGGGKSRTAALLKELKALGWPVEVWAGHSYPKGNETPVERTVLVNEWTSALAKAGAPDLPLWDTENNLGFAGPGATPGQDPAGAKAASLTGRLYLDALRLGISRVYWYAWIPTLSTVGLRGIQMYTGTPAATAYTTLQSWIVGARFRGCTTTRDGNKVVCTFVEAGKVNQVVWAERGAESFTLAKRVKRICTLGGTCRPKGTKKAIRVPGPVLLAS